MTLLFNNIIYKLFHFLIALFLALEVVLFFPEPLVALYLIALVFLTELFLTSFFAADSTGVLTTSLTTGVSTFLMALVVS